MNRVVAIELKVMRVRKGLTIKEASAIIGVDPGTLCRYENGEIDLTVEKIENIVKAYGVSINIFFNEVCANMHEE